MENKIDVSEIVKIEQMPKVFSQLEMIGTFIDEKIKDIDILECTEDNKAEVKKRRTEINNILKELDDRRKFIKNKILEPYELFNEKYEQECKGKLMSASEVLKTKIDTIEEEQKKKKYNEIFDFAMEYFVANDIQEIVKFEDIGLNITLGASMKSLQEQVIDFCERIKQDIELIKMEEYRDEILYEYKRNHNFVECKKLVLDRHKEIERIVNVEELRKQNEEAIKQVEEKVEEVLVAPKEIIEDDEIISVTFTINDTKENIVKVREFMKKEGIEYE
jgi:hypothetical protein